jgi:hypothetical protein
VSAPILRSVVVAVAGILAPFVVVPAGAQVEWPPASEFGPREDERPVILGTAAQAGLRDPVRARLTSPQFGCRGVVLESERLYVENRRSWRRVSMEDGTPMAECLAKQFQSNWRASDRVSAATEWLVERGQVRVWITLTEYYDGRLHTISYVDARRVVLAFIDNRVVDRRKPGTCCLEDPPLPVGPQAQQIIAVASRDGGWEVSANGWTFDVEPRAGRLIVTASTLPIP